jgi:RNA polymerase sigma factor (sigma-70 family)
MGQVSSRSISQHPTPGSILTELFIKWQASRSDAILLRLVEKLRAEGMDVCKYRLGGRDPRDASQLGELVENAMEDALRGTIKLFRPGEGANILTYFRRAVNNRITNVFEAKKSAEESCDSIKDGSHGEDAEIVGDVEQSLVPGCDVGNSQRAAAVLVFCEHVLNPTEWRVLELVYVEDLDSDEIAVRLGMKKSEVSAILKRINRVIEQYQRGCDLAFKSLSH